MPVIKDTVYFGIKRICLFGIAELFVDIRKSSQAVHQEVRFHREYILVVRKQPDLFALLAVQALCFPRPVLPAYNISELLIAAYKIGPECRSVQHGQQDDLAKLPAVCLFGLGIVPRSGAQFSSGVIGIEQHYVFIGIHPDVLFSSIYELRITSECLVWITRHPVSVLIHFCHHEVRLRQAFCRLLKQLCRSFAVSLHIDAVFVRQAHEVQMLRPVIRREQVFSARSADQFIAKHLLHRSSAVHIRRCLYAKIVSGELQAFGPDCLKRRNGLAQSLSCRVLFLSHIIAGFQQIGRHCHRKDVTALNSCPDGIIEVFARNEEFIVPYGHVTAEIHFVYPAHHLIRVLPVLLAVAHEYARYKLFAYLSLSLRAYQKGIYQLSEFVRVTDRRLVILVPCQVLYIAEYFTEQLIRLAHERDRNDRYVVLLGKRYLEFSRPAAFREKASGHRHCKSTHLTEPGRKIIRIIRRQRFCFIVKRAVIIAFEYI